MTENRPDPRVEPLAEILRGADFGLAPVHPEPYAAALLAAIDASPDLQLLWDNRGALDGEEWGDDETNEARSSHSDVSADLPRTGDELHRRETDRLEARLWANDEQPSLAGYRQLAFDAISLLKDSTFAAPSARAEAAPEREGLDRERLARAIDRYTGAELRGEKFPTVRLAAERIAAEYARLAPTSPSSEETPE